MKVICIDDSNKPNKISKDLWIRKGEIYTVIRVVRLSLQKDKLGLVLKEVQLDKSCFPYEFYDSDRFIMAEDILDKSEISNEVMLEADLESLN